MTSDDVKNLRDMFEHHMELPADQMAELFDVAEAAVSAAPKTKAKVAAVESPAPAADTAKADTLSTQG